MRQKESRGFDQAESFVEKLLDCDEFRRHCDRYKCRKAILANLR